VESDLDPLFKGESFITVEIDDSLGRWPKQAQGQSLLFELQVCVLGVNIVQYSLRRYSLKDHKVLF
jgi:hypothetical protein